MSPADPARSRVAAILGAILLVGLLPAAVLAVGPTAVDDHVSVPVNAPATTLGLLDNDLGPGNVIQSAVDPAHGTVVVAADKLSLTYQPDLGFHGTEAFDYTIKHGGATDVGTVTVDVNSAPVAVDDPGAACQTPGAFGGAFPVPEDFISPGPPSGYFAWFGTCALLHNDTDVDNDPLTWEMVSSPAHGDAMRIDEEFFAYRPNADYSATDHGLPATDFDSFTYRAFDGYAYSAPATMRIWVAPVNDAPTFVAGPPQVVVGEDGGAYDAGWATAVSAGPPSESWQTVHFEVDTDLNGVPDLFSVPPAIDTTGHLTFTPAPDQVGLVHLTVRAKDDGGITEWDAPDEPAPADTSAAVAVDIVVMPDAVSAVDDEAVLPEDPDPAPWLIDVLANDDFPAGATVTSVTQGTLGLVTIAPDGLSVLYQPDSNANGDDTFTYTLDDGAGSTDTATVDLTVTPTNDDPVANDDSMTVTFDGPAVPVDVRGNDTDVDGDSLSVVDVGTPVKGVATITGGGTGLTYQPNAGESGSDSFSYTVSDGQGGFGSATVHVTIADNGIPTANDDLLTVTEDDPATGVDVLADDTDPDDDALLISDTSTAGKGTVEITGGGTSLTYQPTPDATGSDSFTYTVSDGKGGLAAATVGVTITPVEDDPEAGTDALTLAEDAAATAVDVLSNDSDADDDTLAITGTTDGAKGVVAITGGGTGLTYKPNANANGSDAFTYTIDDGNGGVATGAVDVTITPMNDKPDALNDTAFKVPQGTGANPLAVLGNDRDPDDDALLITSRTNGAHGTVTITGGGTGLTYDPAGLYVGTDVFSYTVSDGHGGTDTATVLLSVVKDTQKPVTKAPVQVFYNGTSGSTTANARITWSATDTGGTGVGSYKLQVSVNGGSYSTITLSSPTATSSTRTLKVNSTYRFRALAIDRGGNVGSYAYGPTFKVVRYQNTSSAVHYAGAWTTSSNSKALGGSHRYTKTAGASVTYTGSLRNVAWIATKTSTSGSAQVWVDGTLVATINLRSSSTGYKKLVYHRDFSTLGTHKIEIRSLGGGRVYFDALTILR